MHSVWDGVELVWSVSLVPSSGSAFKGGVSEQEYSIAQTDPKAVGRQLGKINSIKTPSYKAKIKFLKGNCPIFKSTDL